MQSPWDKIVMQYHEGMQPIVLDASPLPETNESLPIVLTEQARSVTVKIWVKNEGNMGLSENSVPMCTPTPNG